MGNKITLLLLTLVLTVSISSAATLQIDPGQTEIQFSVKHLVFLMAQGHFTDFTGSIQANPENKTLSTAEATIQADSVDTQSEKRDNYLRSQSFLDVQNYPTIHFKSKQVTGSGDTITLTGEITIKGITRDIILQGSFVEATHGPQGELHIRFAATGTITRADFNLNQNKSTEFMLGDKIQIRLNVEATAPIVQPTAVTKSVPE